jgi:hypothetical protein
MRGPYEHRTIFNARNPAPFFSVSSPKIHQTPHPPYLWKSFFDHFISCNLQYINSLHFCTVDESVTANPRFFPVFGPKSAVLPPDWRFFDGF